MNDILHHIPESILAAYASGHLPRAFAFVVAGHISLCDQCRAGLEAHYMMGGITLESCDRARPSSALRERVLDALDDPVDPEPMPKRHSLYPAPIADALGQGEPRWASLGRGIKHMPLCSDAAGTARLLYIPAGQAVPDHGHNGLELTLVLQGSFADEEGRFARGDVEVADQATDHKPVAEPGMACICLAATDAPLRFNEWAPRLLQPLIGI